MEGRDKQLIDRIEHVLSGDKAKTKDGRVKERASKIVPSEQQRNTLAEFDRFNELEAHCSLGTRAIYLSTLSGSGDYLKKPFEDATKEELQRYVSVLGKVSSEGTMNKGINVQSIYQVVWMVQLV